MIRRNTGWNTEAVLLAYTRFQDGIDPSTAAVIVGEIEHCPQCGNAIDPDATDAIYEDRDVIWEDRSDRSSTAHTCAHCGISLRIFVEEKALGAINEDQLPENAAQRENWHYIPVEDSSAYLVINASAILVAEAEQNMSSHACC